LAVHQELLVQGCSTFFGVVSVIAPTQPDQVDAGAPAAGAGGPYRLSISGGRVSRCADKRGAAVDLPTCLRAAAYSSFVSFTSDRVILKVARAIPRCVPRRVPPGHRLV
jgi:hypothetical protein